MVKKLFILALLLPLLAYSQNSIRYKIFYNDDLERNGLKVQVDYTLKKPSDTLSFYFANENWGEKNLFNTLTLLKEENPDIGFETQPEKSRIKINMKEGNKVSFIYHIRQDFKDPSYTIFNRPRINNTFFHVLGKNLFMVPLSFTKNPEDREFEFSVEWLEFPAKFRLHNNFATQARAQNIKTTLWDGFYNSLFTGGDYRFYSFKVQNKPVYFALRDQWHNGFTDDFLFSNLKKAVQSQRDFWKDYDQNYFTVTMTPTVSQKDSLFKGYSTTGSAIKNAFMIQGTNNPFNDKNSYLYLLHHELMHEWIGNKIQNKNEELNYWFSEGFTDYYTYKNRLRIKDISADEWLRLFNSEVIRNHWKNPQRDIPNYKIKDDFWKSRDVEKVPYRRGAIFAFWLDNQILLKSRYRKSLDDLMRELLKKCTEKKLKFTDELFLDLVQQYLDRDITYFFQKHIISGEDIDLTREKWIDGFEFKNMEAIPQLEIDRTKNLKYAISEVK
ncbi:M1 family aminopeptidase [Chryseobacterium arthrosphaerae]|uniref:Peptidase n=1 Tax=Chryseobacterium arthrosphaerae TaxID=651561 RepID=A0A1B8ZRM9_9FLAO|nr:M1 family aminopeptidase [Chryseobacterium arthrosphaerae]OCA74240.1 peptidase [Chryseobacterium arthrosphaerae]